MRIIKFRGWCKEDQRMLPPCHLGINRKHWYWLGSYPAQLMQYTGLNDRNGREIYEGDILTWYVNEISVTGEVFYSAQAFDMRNKKQSLICWDSNRGTCEVVGNIYENPELLEVGR